MTKKYTVSAICTGNICRSAMAEVILSDIVAKRGLDGRIEVISSGVSSEEHGHPIDPRAQKVLRERGYALPESHFAHKITREEIEATDLFLPMTQSHMRSLLRMLPPADRENVHMYRSFDPSLPKPQPGCEYQIDLADPWYGGPEDFEVAIGQIESAAPHIVDWIEQQLSR